MGVLNRASPVSRTLAVLLAVLMLAWAGWLWNARKTPLDYVVAKARRVAVMPACGWVPIKASDIASFGFDTTDPAGWTTSKTAYLAFRATQQTPWHVDLGVVAVVGSGVTVSADRGVPQPIPLQPIPGGKIVRLPLSPRTPDGVHVVTIRVANPGSPSGHDLRWLGVAIANLRVCDSPEHPGG
ncbi:MAG: hypothetical protein OJF55_001891 [Rhodanobacteraceae bacterium]|jgi:hypothetical protein|nr:MAG: hypothetical protein OJF55_001891 [Rhodanobacteraceae bacterium]